MSAAVKAHLLKQAQQFRDDAESHEISARHHREHAGSCQANADKFNKLAAEFEAAASAINNV